MPRVGVLNIERVRETKRNPGNRKILTCGIVIFGILKMKSIFVAEVAVVA